MISKTILVLCMLVSADHGIDRFTYSNYLHWLFRDVHERLAARLIEQYDIGKDSRILEILYTAPFVSIEMAQHSDARFFALAHDSTDSWFSSARITGMGLTPKFTITTGAIDTLPYPDAWFDLVIARDALRFWSDDPHAFAEIDRVLKDGGVALLGAGLSNTVPDSTDKRLWSLKQGWWIGHARDLWYASSPFPSRTEAALCAAGVREYRVWTEEDNADRLWITWHRTAPHRIDLLDMDSILAAQDAHFIGKKAPDFTLTGPSWDTVTLSDLTGDVVMLAFWKTQYQDWTVLTHDLKALFDSLGMENMRCLTINMDRDSSLVRFYYMDFPIPYPVLYDNAGVAQYYDIQGIPQFIIIDEQGIVRARIRGSTEETIDRIRTAVLSLARDHVPAEE